MAPASVDAAADAWEVRRTLDALPPAEREVVRLAHLDQLTQVEIAERLDIPLGPVKSRMHPRDEAVARMLDDPAVWADVPVGLRDRVAAAAREAVADEPHGDEPPRDEPRTDEPRDDDTPEGVRPTGPAPAHRPRPSPPAPAPAPAPAPTELDAHRRRRRRSLLAAAAAVIVVCVGLAGVLVAGRSDTDADVVEVALAGTGEAPAAEALVRLRDEPAGLAVGLSVDALEPAPDGTFYEAWLVGESGKVSAGTFHLRGDQDEIELWLGVDIAGYEAVTVTRQPGGVWFAVAEDGSLVDAAPVDDSSDGSGGGSGGGGDGGY